MEYPLVETSQVPLVTNSVDAIGIEDERRVFFVTVIIPAYAAAVSSLVLLIHTVAASRLSKAHIEHTEGEEVHDRLEDDKRVWNRLGNKTIFVFRFLRLDAVISLLILDVYSAWKYNWIWESLIPAAVTDYMVFLAALNTFAAHRVAGAASSHLTFVSTVTFLIYAYRNLWPLMTFTLEPLDAALSPLLWVKLALTAAIGIALPLFEPYPYIPLHSEESDTQPSPEETASIASFMFYTFLDPTIWKAYRVPHLSYDELPSLCDYDDAAALKKRSYPYLDPFSGAKKGNLFFGLVRMFKKALFNQSLVLIVMALARLASPVATNRLLNYFEQGSESSFVKPWVWIVLIALGPLTYSVTHELYQFLSTATCVRIESIVTSLVFDHALRLRVKAETSDPNPTTDDSSAPASVTVEPGVAIVPPTNEPGTVSGDADLALVKDAEQTPKPANRSGSENLSGKLNNLVTSDLDNITAGRDFLLVDRVEHLVLVPDPRMETCVLTMNGARTSSVIGFVVMMAVFPVPTLGASVMDKTEERKMKATDARVQHVTEMMNSLRMIKLFGWETHAKEEAFKKRDEELKWVWRRRLLEIANGIVNHVIPMLHMVVTFTIYTIVMKQELNASIVFSSLGANVSLRRVSEFLSDAELLDSFTQQADFHNPEPATGHTEDIGFGHADFTWSTEATEGTATPSQQRFRLSVEGDLIFKKGGFNVIVGPTGSGKTSVLMALLGEMLCIPKEVHSWFNLPREGGVAYAAQESWVQSDSIKDNILFGALYDEERYQKVLYQCALRPDLELLDAGDATEVGEKGITLSGGQKDTHTARWIVTTCFKGDLVKGRTVILVTHNTPLVAPIADFVVSLGSDGKVVKQGTAFDVLSIDPKALDEVDERDLKEPGEPERSTETDAKDASKDGKLIVAEEVEVGRIGDRWLDITPTSRVLARCTGDIQSVDTTVALYLSWLSE
ncbi:hypothetical protein EIP86_008243 [Pleurotus ostreatoroseus]|nr:hypothetical protein EIP86_008243 [Pleurotus ostreatoroseus]